MPKPKGQPPPRFSIVTGASSGLGRAFAERLASVGSDLLLVARNQERLGACAADLTARYGVQADTLSLDLSLPGSTARVFDRVRTGKRVPDTLINDAGFNVYGRFEDSDLEKELEMIRLHAISVTELSKGFLCRRDRSAYNRILNVASLAALVPGPKVSVHFATRAYLLSFSLALSEEFAGSDVAVTCLCPGPMRTDFFHRAGMSDVRLANDWPIKSMSATEVARQAYAAMMKGKRMVVPGVSNKVFAVAADLAPRPLKTRFTHWIMGRV